MFNLPNLLTLSRIAILPALVGLFYVPGAWAAWLALSLYTYACITDFLDGWLARSRDQVSAFGKFLDPIADKILVATLLVMLAGYDRLSGWWLLAAVIIMIREFMVAGLREYLGPQNVRLPVTTLAKWKTTIQMVALGFLIIGPYGEVILPQTMLIGHWGLAIAALLTVITGWGYLKKGFLHMQDSL